VTRMAASPAGGPEIFHISKPTKLDPLATVIELRLAGPLKVVDSAAPGKP